MDRHFLERRAKKLLLTEDMRNLTEIPEEIQNMLYEGYECFLYLTNSSCIILSSASLELALKMKLSEKNVNYAKSKYKALIEKAKDLKLFSSAEASNAHVIRKFRNTYVHSNKNELMESAQCIEVNIKEPLNTDLDKQMKQRIIKLFQLREIKSRHAQFCLLNSYYLIRKLYPLNDS